MTRRVPNRPGARGVGRSLVLAPLLVAVLLGVTGCGVPAAGTTRLVDDGDVPYRLLEASPSAPAPSTAPPGEAVTVPQLYLVDPDGLLRAQPIEVEAGTAMHVEDAVLAALATGPTDVQRAAGLSSALGPEVRLRVIDLVAGTARVDIQVAVGGPSADRLPLAVGQIVLTTTSVQGVDRVVLVQDGQPLPAPLPDGEQTSDPLEASDYASLLAPGTGPRSKASTHAAGG